MKKRNLFRRQRSQSSRGSAPGGVFSRAQRKRKSWTFEHLEARHYFSAAPLSIDWHTASTGTPEGAAEVWMRELAWVAWQSATAAQNAAGAGANGLIGVADYTAALRALPNDPYLSQQWHLINLGQQVGNPDYQVIFGVPGEDINWATAWDAGLTGEGVLVGVLDSGIDVNHPDLAANIHPSLRFGPANNPLDAHGTAVSGLIGAVANNDEGGVGVAPGVQLVPMQLGGTTAAVVAAYQFALANDVDIINNSWGPEDLRRTNGSTFDMTPEMLMILRNSVLFGRKINPEDEHGLGMINVWASGNGAGTGFVEGFPDIGTHDSAAYDPYVNSRYTIGVAGVDHDGLYVNVDGTFTGYAEPGPSVLVSAPLGSYSLNVGDDVGAGSGIFTTDLTGDNGYNIAPLPNGFEIDSDYFDDPNYTSRFNGTSAAAPIVTGVIALMLEANPDLTWRDVQDILVRSARQNAQFEIASFGGGTSFNPTTWQTNQHPIFQEPDLFLPPDPMNPPLVPPDPFTMVYNPIMGSDFFFFGGFVGDGALTQEPELFMNAAGFTVSEGYGVYSELIGYGHGVVDAGMAVELAQQWHLKNQNLAPEQTFTTFVDQLLLDLPAAERGNRDSGFILVPGGLGGDDGFIAYWNEYFADDDPDDPEDGPFSGDDPPVNSRGFSHLVLDVPEDQNMVIESVDVKFSIGGPAGDLDFIRLLLVSPDGTFSELNDFWIDPNHANPWSGQNFSPRLLDEFDPGGDIDTNGGSFVWTFNTNRSWGERSDNRIVYDPVTREPVVDPFFGAPLEQGWRLVVENWSNSDFDFDAIEVAWHGHPIGENSHRVRGFVGLDQNGDAAFNYDRYDTFAFDLDGDGALTRLGEVTNLMDLTQEPFVANATVSAHRVVDGVVESDPIARFITGHDGNYYFDLVPDEYIITIDNPELQDRMMDDEMTPEGFLKLYQQSWHITEDWFRAYDYEDIDVEAYVKPRVLADVDGTPMPFLGMDILGNPTEPVVDGIAGLNFLLEPEDLPSTSVNFEGMVYVDLNGNGQMDGDDLSAVEFTVYHDENRNGSRDSGEITTLTDSDGNFTLTVMGITELSVIDVGVVPPNSDWTATDPTSAVLSHLVRPGDMIDGLKFGFEPPPGDPNGGGGDPNGDEPGNILGLVFNDQNGNRTRDPGEQGIAGIRVFVDADESGTWGSGEIFSITAGNGSYFLPNIEMGAVRVDIEISPLWELTTPVAGFIDLQLDSDETILNVRFGLKNLATRDFGDLPNSFQTTAASGGPSHLMVPGFRLGATIDGELDGQPTSNARGDDDQVDDEDGIVVASNFGTLSAGANTLQVTVSGVGGLLTGWIDWNDNGQFDASERVMWTEGSNLVGELHLNPGTHSLVINAPSSAVESDVGARFRWGEAGLSFTGAAGAGEVEDYMLPFSGFVIGDYDRNGSVQQADYDVWRATYGMAVPVGTGADGNRDGQVDLADWVLWRKAFSTGSGGGAVATASLSTSTAASEGSSESPSDPPLLASLSSFDTISVSSDSGSKTVRGDSTVAAQSSDDLLVLDAIWADSGAADEQDAVAYGDNELTGEGDSLSDLALAAAFSDETDWRASL